MAINKNHEFEELNGIKCAIVEKNASQERVDFLRQLLELNKYTVVVIPTPVVPAKPAAATPAAPPTPSASPASALPAEGSNNVLLPSANLSPVSNAETNVITNSPPESPPPATFTIGVTEVGFNPVNAIFGRLLKTREGNTVTLAYWQQKENISNDDIPYFDNQSMKG